MYQRYSAEPTRPLASRSRPSGKPRMSIIPEGMTSSSNGIGAAPSRSTIVARARRRNRRSLPRWREPSRPGRSRDGSDHPPAPARTWRPREGEAARRRGPGCAGRGPAPRPRGRGAGPGEAGISASRRKARARRAPRISSAGVPYSSATDDAMDVVGDGSRGGRSPRGPARSDRQAGASDPRSSAPRVSESVRAPACPAASSSSLGVRAHAREQCESCGVDARSRPTTAQPVGAPRTPNWRTSPPGPAVRAGHDLLPGPGRRR
jgi:hypothetical protein